LYATYGTAGIVLILAIIGASLLGTAIQTYS
jgi:hypothetical protein